MFVQYVRLRLQGVKKDVKDPKVTKDMPPVPSGCVGGTHADRWVSSRRCDEPALREGGNEGPSSEQQAVVQSDWADRDADDRTPRAHASHGGEDRELNHLSGAEADRLRQSVFATEMHLNMSLDTDYDFSHDVSNNSYHRQVQRMIKQFQLELDTVTQQTSRSKFHVPQLDVLEVMCSSDSELTKQMSNIGGISSVWIGRR